MAGMMDDMKSKMGDKMSGVSDELKERFSMLKNKEKEGSISESERSELQQLKSRFGNKGGQ